KYNDFTVSTKSKSASFVIKDKKMYNEICYDLLNDGYSTLKPVRLLGVSISNLDNEQIFGKQLEIPFKDLY
ncbi:MAG: DNA polymerase IV, partial [Algoriella sp.]